MDLRSVVRSDEEALQADRQFPWFLLAIGALIVSAVVFVALIVAAANGGGGPTLVPGGLRETPTPADETPAPSASANAAVTTPATTVAPGTRGATATVPGGATTAPTSSAKVVGCGDILAPLDKEHRLTEDCAPGDLQQLAPNISYGQQFLRSAAAAAFNELVADASRAGFSLVAVSAYRSYQTQVVTFQSNVESGGLEYAERTSARAGHSEHQLGTTVDVSTAAANYSLEGFGGSAEAQWLAENGWKFGFIISYPAGKEGITGYAYEPWHIRWLGRDVAGRVRSSGLTLHEFLLR